MRRKRPAAPLCPAPPPPAMRLLLLFVAVPLLILLSPLSRRPPHQPPPVVVPCGAAPSDATAGRWVPTPRPVPAPLYGASCPFHRGSYNCLRNGRPPLAPLSWAPARCGGAVVVPRIDAAAFLAAARGRRVGLVGDSLNENLAVALLCALHSADPAARRWKRRGAWRGGYFPRHDVTVAFHRAVLLAKHTWVPVENDSEQEHRQDGRKGIYRVDVDVPADEWINATTFYDVLIFNTGHWWGTYKFPKETPLVFYRGGKPMDPPMSIPEGLKLVVRSMAAYVDREAPSNTLKLWRTQSPRHFHGGEWDRNGSCVTDRLLGEDELEAWFDPRLGGVNRDARTVNLAVEEALAGSGFRVVNLTYVSEFRADAHPAAWLGGKQGAVAVYGQDCMHWCVPGVPDTWVDLLAPHIILHFRKHRGNG
ncbi:hypothetical protein U9M48_025901 [Paspalum notatum var. saurae]|uniref:Trichome birefringence-like N-terminal domain-containing protein n=1 Tax=Paspalum notatum var. saurae TaxID=547442 RepID=A0AAQ3TUU3_PASNO